MKIKTLLKVTSAVVCLAASANAQEWKSTLNKFKPGKFSELKPIQLTYSASWNNALKSGKVSFIFGKKSAKHKNYYISQCYGGSSFNTIPYKFDMTSFSQRKTFRPILLVANESDNKEKVAITNRFKTGSVSHSKITNETNGKSKTETHTFKASTIHDPLTAILFIRSQKLNNGDKINLCLHPFSTPYYTTVTVIGREMHMGKKCIKLDVSMRKIDRKSGNLKEYKKLKKATIWFSDDNQRIPLEIRTQVSLGKIKFGSIRLTLTAQQKP